MLHIREEVSLTRAESLFPERVPDQCFTYWHPATSQVKTAVTIRQFKKQNSRYDVPRVALSLRLLAYPEQGDQLGHEAALGQ